MMKYAGKETSAAWANSNCEGKEVVCDGHWMVLYSKMAFLSLELQLLICLDSLIAMPCPSGTMKNTPKKNYITQWQ